MKRILLFLLCFSLIAAPSYAMREIGYDDQIHIAQNGIEAETAAYMGIQSGLTTAQIMAVNDNIKAIKYSTGVTLSSLTAKFSTVAPTFVTQISQDLRWLAILNATVPITATWSDGTNTLAMYPVAAGTGETTPTDLLSGWDFTAIWTNQGAATISDSNTFVTVAAGGIGRTIATLGANKLYKLIISSQANCSPRITSTPTTFFSPNATSYATLRSANMLFYLRNAAAGTTDVTVMQLYQVLTPSTSGFTASDLVGASFNPDVATYTLNIVRR